MKTLVALLVGLALGGAVLTGIRTTPSRPPTIEPPVAPEHQVGTIYPLAHNLYVIPGGGGNTAVFVTSSGVLLVDTKYPGTFPAILEQVRTVTDKPIVYAINTHMHGDHSGTNGDFPPDTEIIAHENSARYLNEWTRAHTAPGGVPHTVRGYQDSLTLFSGDETVELHHFGPAHTNGDTFVVFRAAGVMHTGDVFPGKETPIISLETGGNGITFADTIERAAAVPGVHTVLPSHGPVVTHQDLVEFTTLYGLLFDHVRDSMLAGLDKNVAFKSFVPPAEFAEYRMRRAFITMDEIDRSIRPAWLRRLPPVFSRYLLSAAN